MPLIRREPLKAGTSVFPPSLPLRFFERFVIQCCNVPFRQRRASQVENNENHCVRQFPQAILHFKRSAHSKISLRELMTSVFIIRVFISAYRERERRSADKYKMPNGNRLSACLTDVDSLRNTKSATHRHYFKPIFRAATVANLTLALRE